MGVKNRENLPTSKMDGPKVKSIKTFIKNGYFSKSLLPVNPCPKNSTAEVTLMMLLLLHDVMMCKVGGHRCITMIKRPSPICKE